MSYRVSVPFFGGRDDRESLAYGMRMAEHPGILLTAVKFVAPPGKTFMFGANLVVVTTNNDKKVIKEGEISTEDDKQEDEELWSAFVSAKNESMVYEERVVESKEEIMKALKEMNRSNLVMVGRMPPVAPLVNNSDCKELGPVGTYLASSEFSTTASVMVVQQYNPTTDVKPLVIEATDDHYIPDTPRDMV